eukprot:scaffold198015_cov31-Tisochrysis_lutea.AAC.3
MAFPSPCALSAAAAARWAKWREKRHAISLAGNESTRSGRRGGAEELGLSSGWRPLAIARPSAAATASAARSRPARDGGR